MGNKLGYPEVDLSGKVAIVTGANTGIGYETAKALARLGAHIIIACRTKERAEGAIEQILKELDAASEEEQRKQEREQEQGEGHEREEGRREHEEQRGHESEGKQKAVVKDIKVEYLPLDLSSLQSTIEFVRLFKERNLPLHLLINNAGIAFVAYRKTEDGFESHFQVNYLSHMLLTLELLPVLLDTAAADGDVRIINVSSSAHYLAQPFDPEQLNKSEQEYRRFSGYSNSKLQNVLFGYSLQRRLQGKGITVSSIDPGLVKTEGTRGALDWKGFSLAQRTLCYVAGRTPAAGAATTINCAVNPDLNSQQHFYYASCQPKQPSADARNERFQEELWNKSFEFLKDCFSSDIMEKYGPQPDTGLQEISSSH